MLLACGLPLILPQMNARMLFLAGLIALSRLDSPLRAVQAALLETVSVCCYVEAIFSSDAVALWDAFSPSSLSMVAWSIPSPSYQTLVPTIELSAAASFVHPSALAASVGWEGSRK